MKKLIFLIFLLNFLLLPLSNAQTSLVVDWSVLSESLAPNEQTSVILTLTNPSSTDEIKDVLIRIYPSTYLTVEPSTLLITSIPSLSTQKTSFIIKALPNAKTYESYVKLRFEYKVEDGETESKSLEIILPISIKTRPRIEVYNVSFDKEIINAGDKVKLSFFILNEGKEKAKNINLVLNSSVVKVLGLNSVFIEELLPFQKKEVQFEFVVDPSLEPNLYSIPLVITYNDPFEKQTYSNQKIIGLKISGIPEVLITSETSKVRIEGEEGSINLKIANTGKVKILGATLNIKSNLTFFPSTIYIGDLEPGDYDTEKITFFGKQLEKIEFEAELVYKDVYNNLYVTSKKFELSALSLQKEDHTLLFGLIVIFVALLLLFIFYKKKKKTRR